MGRTARRRRALVKRSGPLARHTPLRTRQKLQRQSDAVRDRIGAEAAILADVRARDGGVCQYPAADHWGGPHVHHILPRGRGGTTIPTNLTTLCAAHHAYVHDHPRESREGGWLR